MGRCAASSSAGSLCADTNDPQVAYHPVRSTLSGFAGIYAAARRAVGAACKGGTAETATAYRRVAWIFTPPAPGTDPAPNTLISPIVEPIVYDHAVVGSQRLTDSHVAPPGFYTLYALDANHVPSAGTVIRIS